jgi:hypothetical protein
VGFRFRRSVKLMPGIRVNLSTRGASLSLGGRGATVNLSSRGTRTTVGIPGSGLSYSSFSSAGAGSRRPSATQLAAQYRRIEQEQDRASALAEVARIESELRDTLSAWRANLTVTPEAEVRAGLQPRNFESEESPPPPPDYGALEAQCASAMRELVRQAHPLRVTDKLKAVAVGAVAGLLASVANPLLALLAAPLAGWLGWLAVVAQWKRRLAPLEVERASAEWPSRQRSAQYTYAGESAQYLQRLTVAQQAFQRADTERITALRAALMGDPEAIEDAVTAHIEGIDFPFETECRVAVDDEDHVLIDLDLPEIEDVVPETEYKVLKNGTLKEAKRKVGERNAAYAELVCGLTMTIGAAALSAAPTLAAVSIAACTQRQKRASVELEDAYVIEVKLTRSSLQGVQGATVDPVAFIRRVPSRLVQMANGSLKKIPAPAWAGGFTR